MGKPQRSNVIAIRAPPHRELACGFNGVRATKPRLYGTVEVRSPAGIPIAAIYVSLALYCHENISYRPEGRSSLTSQKQSTTTIVGKELLLWQAPDGRSHEDIMSMDLPFMIPFPIATDEVLAATLNHSSRSTTYEVAATLHSTQFASERVALEVIMERFDQLPIWGMFAEAQLLKPVSIDHIVEMELQLPRTCYGPSDAIVCTITLSGNPDWPARVKKVRAEKLTMALEKVVTYHPPSTSSLPTHTTIKKITDQRIDFGGLKLLDAPITQRITMSFPKPDTLVRDKSGLVHHANQMSPPSPNFTTKCRLYSVAFQITVKATFKGAKEIVSTTPIIASQYNLSESRVILENIESAVYEGADIDVVAGISGNPVIVKHSPSGGHQGGSAVTGMGDRRRTVIME